MEGKEDLKIVICKECGGEMELDANFCPNCGAENYMACELAKKRELCWGITALTAVAAAALVGMAIYYNTKESNRVYRKIKKALHC